MNDEQTGADLELRTLTACGQSLERLPEAVRLRVIGYLADKYANAAVLVRPTPPQSLARIKGLLAGPVGPRACGPGVYFLCDGPEVAYVGSSCEVYSRAAQHIGSKVYDRWYWIAVPPPAVTGVEGGFIRFLQPTCNRNRRGVLTAPACGDINPYLSVPLTPEEIVALRAVRVRTQDWSDKKVWDRRSGTIRPFPQA